MLEVGGLRLEAMKVKKLEVGGFRLEVKVKKISCLKPITY